MQLEKLLQKNYFLHQSARDGFRSYLQAYASYSLKKIFDVNALDLAKIGKAFGFAVPPRVNVNIGGGQSTKHGRKRAREVDDEDGEEGGQDQVEEREEGAGRQVQRRHGKGRRIETLGRKKVGKEVYRKGKNPKTGNWSR